MNTHMRAAGAELAERIGPTSSTATTGSSPRPARRWPSASTCPYLTTIHATEFGRHQGWVGKHPQSYIHRIETRMAKRADGVITCSHYMRGHVADVFGIDEARVAVIPNGIDPDDLVAVDDLDALRARFAAPRGPARAADRPARLREGLPGRAGRAAGADRAARRRPLPRRRLGHARAGAQEAGDASSA